MKKNPRISEKKSSKFPKKYQKKPFNLGFPQNKSLRKDTKKQTFEDKFPKNKLPQKELDLRFPQNKKILSR